MLLSSSRVLWRLSLYEREDLFSMEKLQSRKQEEK